MAYCNVKDVLESWADLTEIQAGPARVGNAIEFADALIDASLVHRYEVPFNPTPPLIKGVSMDFSAFIAKYRKDPRMVTDPQSEGERQVALANDILQQLKEGKMNLPGVTERQMIESTMEDYPPIFNLDEEVFHDIHEDQADAIADARD